MAVRQAAFAAALASLAASGASAQTTVTVTPGSRVVVGPGGTALPSAPSLGGVGAVPGQFAPDGRLVLTPEFCRSLFGDQRVAGPDYVPGVAVGGAPVAPADLPASPGGADSYGLGDRVNLDILFDPLSGRTSAAGAPGLRGQGYIGTVTIDGSGGVWINGQPVGGADRSGLAAACARLR